ncbi:MAG: potassium channel family protein [Acidobacteriota bacterium]
MIEPFVGGVLLTLLTVAIHIMGLVHLGQLLGIMVSPRLLTRSLWHRSAFLSVAVLLLILLHLLGAGIWALYYCWVGEFDGFQTALYFSVVTATSLGYGDITLSESWRLLAVFEAMSGLLLFGASTASIFQLMVKTLPDPLESRLESAQGRPRGRHAQPSSRDVDP